MEDKTFKNDLNEEVEKPKAKNKILSNFRNFRIWLTVLAVYMSLFMYIGYIAFWPMSFNDPRETVKKYYEIINDHNNEIASDLDKEHFRSIITDLVKESESEADDMQQLASQSFNIVLGAFLAFLSATVTTIFQINRE